MSALLNTQKYNSFQWLQFAGQNCPIKGTYLRTQVIWERTNRSHRRVGSSRLAITDTD